MSIGTISDKTYASGERNVLTALQSVLLQMRKVRHETLRRAGSGLHFILGAVPQFSDRSLPRKPSRRQPILSYWEDGIRRRCGYSRSEPNIREKQLSRFLHMPISLDPGMNAEGSLHT